MNRITFIGAGNMGSAMVGGLVKSNLVSAENITVANRGQDKLEKIKKEFGVGVTSSNRDAVKGADMVIFAVKPNMIKKVLEEVCGLIKDTAIIVSVAAGITIEEIEEYLGYDKKIARVMPNTPALVGEAMSAIAVNNKVNEDDLEKIYKVFNSFGKAEIIEENLMDAVVGLSGSGPAYIFMFMEAMADAAVLSGLQRDKAYKMVGQTVLGAAKMMLDSGKHPGQLKDMVCSPGGTTIAAVEVLEENGLRNAVIKGQLACVEKSKQMSKDK
ncbi:pyrroline-5-carboxylate reductase [Peptostreptococcus equinus]|uniref:Pyrroline-5-carboxylate reductase n=1 Tax=Peptostreptococcus equinus TaxID=3003601 RepID=A0ABY7JNS2_9FIRM|nr:pyrroline-5-carboxylate reductase [Peptostreptococcus sp. CBA3647]WAW15028.1 pyrroline-5-carboxylate reductase [Peptostreptococcus sp. CBA3647]